MKTYFVLIYLILNGSFFLFFDFFWIFFLLLFGITRSALDRHCVDFVVVLNDGDFATCFYRIEKYKKIVFVILWVHYVIEGINLNRWQIIGVFLAIIKKSAEPLFQLDFVVGTVVFAGDFESGTFDDGYIGD